MDVGISVHSAMCVVNSEAMDAARFGRRGTVDGPVDARIRMYDWFIGFQVRMVLDFTDLAAASDVGQAVLECVRSADGDNGL